uniref:Uncharacterized protein n=1 Tax=Sphaerodactylus townsendi TaxID=933632 RepID=A0ACB8FC27_9SAUR
MRIFRSDTRSGEQNDERRRTLAHWGGGGGCLTQRQQLTAKPHNHTPHPCLYQRDSGGQFIQGHGIPTRQPCSEDSLPGRGCHLLTPHTAKKVEGMNPIPSPNAAVGPNPPWNGLSAGSFGMEEN